ncbi:hypothetical protein [Paraburkholderia jirisanensis]
MGNNSGYAMNGFDGGNNSLAQLQDQSDAATSQAAASGRPEDAQAAKIANNKMTEAAQMEAAKETSRHEAFQTMMR